MLQLAVVICVVLWSGPAEAIKWDFGDGTTQGWTTKETNTRGGTREFNQFPGVVEDGVWRITVAPSVTSSLSSRSSVGLVSSTIGYDSGLFDQIRIRFRTVHDRPTEGSLWVEWENSSVFFSNLDFDTEPKEMLIRQIVYTTEWQEIVVSLADHSRWEGLLKNIRLDFRLGGSDTEMVEWFEIDWIELTGVEELIEGELPPPPVEYYFFEETGLFAPPVFYPIAPGLGEAVAVGHGGGYLGERDGSALTDLDGDGDLDLFGLWQTRIDMGRGLENKGGWLMAVNDGRGALERGPIIEEVHATEEIDEEITSIVTLKAINADLTGDGKDEIAISRDHLTEIWSIGPESPSRGARASR